MKIVHVMNWYIPELGYQENFLPAEQQKLGHEVFIITSDRVPFYPGFENNVGKIIKKRIIGIGESKDNAVTIYRMPILFEIKNGAIIAFSGLKRELSQIKPDVVHAHGPYNIATLLSVIYCKKMRYKLFIDDHSNEQNFHINSNIKKMYLQFVKLFYYFFGNNIICWMPVAEPAKKLLIKNFKITEDTIKIVPLGISTERFFQSISIRNATRKELLLENNTFLIITTGKLNESKDIDILIKAFIEVIMQNFNVKLLLIGSGPNAYFEKLKKIVFDNRIENYVIFKDFIKNKDLPRYYNAADIGIWPGTHTITAVESLATGLPIIIPEDDLSHKMIFYNGAALGFERKNIKSLANAIIFLLNNAEKRKDISNNALTLVNDQLSWKKIANDTIQIYTDNATHFS